MTGRDRLLNFVLIVISIAALYAISEVVRIGGFEGEGPLFLTLALTPVIYTLYAVIGRKLVKTTTPLGWFTAALVFVIPMSGIYNQVSTGSIKLLLPYLAEHYLNLLYLLNCILTVWLNCMSVFFVEWVMTSKGDLVTRRTMFKHLALIGTVCLIATPIVFTVMAFKIQGIATILGLIFIYTFWAGYKLLNAFGGLSEQRCDELISSRTEGTKSIDTYRILTGDTAVIFGIRSALIWLSIGLIIMSGVFLNTSMID